jgi:hypothetical protein
MKMRLWNGGIVVADQHVFKTLGCGCRSASFKLHNCDCGPKKKLRMPTSVYKPNSRKVGHIGPTVFFKVNCPTKFKKTPLYVCFL